MKCFLTVYKTCVLIIIAQNESCLINTFHMTVVCRPVSTTCYTTIPVHLEHDNKHNDEGLRYETNKVLYYKQYLTYTSKYQQTKNSSGKSIVLIINNLLRHCQKSSSLCGVFLVQRNFVLF